MKTKIFKPVLMAIVITALLSFDTPEGWIKKGSNPEDYEMGIIKGAGKDGNNAATIKSKNDADENVFGTFMQMFSPEKFLGKQIKMTGFVKSENVTGWAGLWLRVDQANIPLSFDNMQDRAITGTTEWKKYEILLSVPAGATNIAFGALLAGSGQIWFDNIKFEMVDDSNNPPAPDNTDGSDDSVNSDKTKFNKNEPVNLDFEKK